MPIYHGEDTNIQGDLNISDYLSVGDIAVDTNCRFKISDNNHTGARLFCLVSDDGQPWAIVINNSTYGTGSNAGLRFYVSNDGEAICYFPVGKSMAWGGGILGEKQFTIDVDGLEIKSLNDSITGDMLSFNNLNTTDPGNYITCDSVFALDDSGNIGVGSTTPVIYGDSTRPFFKSPDSAPVTANMPNNSYTARIDESGNQLTFTTKDSTGTIKTGSVAIS